MGRREQEPGGETHYQQMSFEAMEDLPTPEISLDRCLVVSPPTYTKKGKSYIWDCVVHTLPDLFNPERNDEYHLHATTYAKEANKKHIQPGDVVRLTGTPYTQEITLQAGVQQQINHITLADMTVLSRAPRQTITIFDPKNGI